MGKHEVGTPKYIANKIKAKGLQKLRWYCQMCQKQCRDENGFKCHTMSVSHQRQLLLFADNAHRYMDQFSHEFSQGYLNLLKRQFGTKRVPANRVYQEYIADRNHVHMNATNWLSLTSFVKWLGRMGLCVVDETEKGWFVTYIDRDPETIAAMEKKAKKEKMDKDDEERMMEFIEKQVEKGKQQSKDNEDGPAPFLRPEDDIPLVLQMKLKPKVQPVPLSSSTLCKQGKSIKKNTEDDKKEIVIKKERIDDEEIEDNSSDSRNTEKRKHKNSLSENSDSNESVPKKLNTSLEKDKKRLNGWLRKDLVVKIVTKSIGDKYYKAKGVIVDIMDKSSFIGKVKLKSPKEVEGHILKIDQEHLETVIPGIGREVIILWGKHEGKKGTVKKVRIEDFCIDVEIKNEIVKKLAYEQVCKYE